MPPSQLSFVYDICRTHRFGLLWGVCVGCRLDSVVNGECVLGCHSEGWLSIATTVQVFRLITTWTWYIHPVPLLGRPCCHTELGAWWDVLPTPQVTILITDAWPQISFMSTSQSHHKHSHIIQPHINHAELLINHDCLAGTGLFDNEHL